MPASPLVFVQTLPAAPTDAKDVQELFLLWMEKMEKQNPSRQLIKDLKARQSTHFLASFYSLRQAYFRHGLPVSREAR